ncbi:MAG: iron-containing alcohol dehydrogenase [Heliobacteriaceae bacterium]|jgi:NADP-dependent alcohol dehydrogenase|nr:iron-containing alcohol dehydrogenase [Heliobacteriaceae bacterium]
MNNFEYYRPTRILFGKGMISQLSSLLDKAQKILLLYGGGSVKKNGVYEQVAKALEGYNYSEFGGIEPNPEYETCMKAVELVKRENIEFILAVGGGSTLDAAKFIAAAAKYEGKDPYDIITEEYEVKDALPVGDVITLPATGSEMNGNSVISRASTGRKAAFVSEKVYPEFSIIDPQTTFSLPVRQTVNGIVDTFVHTMEQYCTYDVNTPLQDEWMLGLLRTLIQEGPKALAKPEDYDARANIFWCATCGLNHFMSLGCVQDWATHQIGHELTAFYGLDHGQSLAIILPRLLQNQKLSKSEKLAKLARNVFGVEESVDLKAAGVAIYKIEEFFNFIGMKTHLADYGIDAGEAAEQARKALAMRNVKLGEKGAVTADTAFEIIRNS